MVRRLLAAPSGGAGGECRNRSIEAWRGGWTVELTDAFAPRLKLHSPGKVERR